ncbi:hypothetical protein [Umezakia ovalisporum]
MWYYPLKDSIRLGDLKIMDFGVAKLRKKWRRKLCHIPPFPPGGIWC